MPSGLRLRSSLSASGRTSLNWSQLPQLRPREERTWRKRVGVEPTPESAKDTGYGFEDHEGHPTPFASANSIVEQFADSQGNVRRAGKREWRPAECGSKRRRGRRAPERCRLHNRDAKWLLRLFHREAVAARRPCAKRAVRRIRQAALPHKTR